MDYYRGYLKEAENKELYEFKEGFIVYFCYEEGTFIDVMYVTPAKRDSDSAVRYTVQLLDIIEKYDKPVYCEVEQIHKDSTAMLHHYLRMGFKVKEMVEGRVVLKMPVEVVKEHCSRYGVGN